MLASVIAESAEPFGRVSQCTGEDKLETGRIQAVNAGNSWEKQNCTAKSDKCLCMIVHIESTSCFLALDFDLFFSLTLWVSNSSPYRRFGDAPHACAEAAKCSKRCFSAVRRRIWRLVQAVQFPYSKVVLQAPFCLALGMQEQAEEQLTGARTANKELLSWDLVPSGSTAPTENRLKNWDRKQSL